MNPIKLALITGASSGLGKALSIALSKQGIPLLLTARSEDKLSALASSLPTACEILPCDLTLREDRLKLIAYIQKKQPDLIINNAGFGLYGPATSLPLEALEEMVEVNVEALMELSVEGAKALQSAQKTGTILNISSATAFFPYPTFCVYAATKAFVNTFSMGLDAEMKKFGIRVLTVCPGQIDTEFRKRASQGFPQKKDRISLSAERAAELILKQLETRKALRIIDWRYYCAIVLSRLLPKRLLQALLERSLKERYINRK